jgi:hypothetical protein
MGKARRREERRQKAAERRQQREDAAPESVDDDGGVTLENEGVVIDPEAAFTSIQKRPMLGAPGYLPGVQWIGDRLVNARNEPIGTWPDDFESLRVREYRRRMEVIEAFWAKVEPYWKPSIDLLS